MVSLGDRSFHSRGLIRLITGLYEEVHGLIADEIYDPKTGNVFQFGENTTNQPWPMKSIWTINEQRVNARSGVIGWLQDSINISRFRTYQQGVSSQSMIDQMLDWLTDTEDAINFGAIYFREPGLTGREMFIFQKQNHFFFVFFRSSNRSVFH